MPTHVKWHFTRENDQIFSCQVNDKCVQLRKYSFKIYFKKLLFQYISLSYENRSRERVEHARTYIFLLNDSWYTQYDISGVHFNFFLLLNIIDCVHWLHPSAT